MAKKIVTTNTKAAAAPQAEPPAGPGPRRQILRSTDLRPGGAEIGDRDYVKAQATDDEIKELREKIEFRQRPSAPAAPGEHTETILVCTNQKCRAWAAYEPKHVPRGLGSCIFCNYRNLKDGGQMRLATPAETTLFWSERRRLQELGRLRAKQAQESELERRRLGIHQLIDHKLGPSIADDMTIKRNR